MADENRLQRRCIEHARQLGVLAVNMHGGGWGNRGFPDLLCFYGSKCVPVELKDGDTYKLQPIQALWQKRFEHVGIKMHVCKSFEEFKRTMKEEFKHGA